MWLIERLRLRTLLASTIEMQVLSINGGRDSKHIVKFGRNSITGFNDVAEIKFFYINVPFILETVERPTCVVIVYCNYFLFFHEILRNLITFLPTKKFALHHTERTITYYANNKRLPGQEIIIYFSLLNAKTL